MGWNKYSGTTGRILLVRLELENLNLFWANSGREILSRNFTICTRSLAKSSPNFPFFRKWILWKHVGGVVRKIGNSIYFWKLNLL